MRSGNVHESTESSKWRLFCGLQEAERLNCMQEVLCRMLNKAIQRPRPKPTPRSRLMATVAFEATIHTEPPQKFADSPDILAELLQISSDI